MIRTIAARNRIMSVQSSVRVRTIQQGTFMSSGNFSPKGQNEQELFNFDFSNVLQANETISSATMSVYWIGGSGDYTDFATTMLVGSPTYSGAIVSQMIGGGLTGNTYNLLCHIQTSLSQKFELSGNVAIKQP